jgi:hypothetical protein
MLNGGRVMLMVGLLGLATAVAHADTLPIGDHAQAKLLGVHSGQTVSFSYKHPTSSGWTTTTFTDFAGEYAWAPAAGSDNPWPLNQPFESFCVDLNEFVRVGSTYDYTIKTLESSPNPDPGSPAGMGTARANALRRLWWQYRSDVEVGTTDQRNIKAAAFQLSVWEIVFESPTVTPGLPSFNLATGTFQLLTSTTNYNSILSKTVTYLTAASNLSGFGESNLVVLSMPNGQDQLVVMRVPASAFGGTMLLGVLAGLRKSRRKSVA